MNTLEFIIPMKPYPKGRPRITKTGKAYTPKTTKQNENFIKQYLFSSLKLREIPLTTAPLYLHIDFIYQYPKNVNPLRKSCNFKKTRPDIDNLVKLVFDAFNGIIYEDDSQVCELSCRKVYGEENGIHIFIKEAK